MTEFEKSLRCIIIGMVVFIFSIVMLISDVQFTKTAVKIDAEIIDREHSPKHDSYHIVEFSVDNEIYSGRIGVLNNLGKEIGDTVTIYYNSKEPSDFRSASIIPAVFYGGLGFISLLIGVIPIIGQKVSKKKCNKKAKNAR